MGSSDSPDSPQSATFFCHHVEEKDKRRFFKPWVFVIEEFENMNKKPGARDGSEASKIEQKLNKLTNCGKKSSEKMEPRWCKHTGQRDKRCRRGQLCCHCCEHHRAWYAISNFEAQGPGNPMLQRLGGSKRRKVGGIFSSSGLYIASQWVALTSNGLR